MLEAGKLSIIMPVLNEAALIQDVLQRLQTLRQQGCEVIVVDGGSTDATVKLATNLADQLIVTEKNRARQMNAGAQQASGEFLLFLHADTILPEHASTLVHNALQSALQSASWGRFDVQIVGAAPMLRVIASLMNWRSRLTGIATGDQAIFVRRTLFEQIGGFPDQALMEDIEISRRLRRRGAPINLSAKVATSGRRWMQYGVWRTIFLMWRLRFLYWLGVSPDKLAKAYR
jgi:rSAM/selenodomain-associated transferase 2